MNPKRISRISQEIKKLISSLLLDSIKDPRISPMTTISEVKVTNDLSYADVYISVYGSPDEKNSSLDGLQSAKGFIKKEIGRNLDLRHVPEIKFHLDETVEHGMHIEELIMKIRKEEEGDEE